MPSSTKKKSAESPMTSNQAEALLTRLEETALFSRDMFARLVDPKRDIDAECGYPVEVGTAQYRSYYKRGDFCARVVDVFPEESWKVDPEVIESEDGDQSPWEKEWDALVRRHNIYGVLQRADRLSRVGQFGILLIGIDDKKQLHEPVDGVNDTYDPKSAGGETKRKLLYLRTFDEGEVDISTYETDVTSPRYGQPTEYTIKLQDLRNGQPAETITQTKIHWSRVIHLADNRQSSDVFGEPAMKPVFNRLYDLRKLLGGSAEMFWKGGFPGFSLETNPDIKNPKFDAASVRAQFEKYSNGLQRYLAFSGMSAKSLAPQVADPSAHFLIQVQAIAVTLGVPYRILLGSEEAKLAGGQDKEAWNERVKRRQATYVVPYILIPFVRRMIEMKVISKPTATEDNENGFLVKFPDISAAKAEDKAKVAETLTNALSKYVSSGLAQYIPFLEYCLHILGMDQETAEALDKAAEELLRTGLGPNDGTDDTLGDEEDPEEVAARGSTAPAQQRGAQTQRQPAQRNGTRQPRTPARSTR